MHTSIILTLILGSTLLAGLLVLLSCALRAPEGYEDARGFYPGRDAASSRTDASPARSASRSFKPAA